MRRLLSSGRLSIWRENRDSTTSIFINDEGIVFIEEEHAVRRIVSPYGMPSSFHVRGVGDKESMFPHDTSSPCHLHRVLYGGVN